MFENQVINLMKQELEKSLDEIKQNLILDNYLIESDSKRKGTVKTSFIKSVYDLFPDISIVGDTANVNKFIFASKFNKYFKETFSFFPVFKNEELINNRVLDAINLTKDGPQLLHNLKTYKMYKNDSDFKNFTEINFQNVFYMYILSFASSNFFITNSHKYLKGRILNLAENQISSLPMNLSYVEEMKILNKISDNILNDLTKTKQTPTFLNQKITNRLNYPFNNGTTYQETLRQTNQLKKNMLYFQKTSVYINLIFKKNYSIAKYIIPHLITKVKLSEEIIERFVSLCQEHLINNMASKIEELELNQSLLEPFVNNRIFSKDIILMNAEYKKELTVYHNAYKVLNLKIPDYHHKVYTTKEIEEDGIPF